MLCNLPDTYSLFSFFFFNDTATTEIYTLSLHDALPISSAATDLAGIGSIISEANTFAAGPTLGVLPAGADEVSAAIAALFDAHGQAYQALSAQAALFHDQFVQILNGAGSAYAAAEANAVRLMANAVSAPAQAVSAAA